MPIYMDIHDTTGARIEDVAADHQRDLTLQDKFNCKFIYFWHDTPNHTGFCVFDAPDKESVINLHNKSHGNTPNQIIEVELNEVELFLGKIANIAWSKKNSPFDGYINKTAHRTILYIEIVNPLLLKSVNGNGTLLNFLNLQKKIIKDSFLKYEGNIVSWENDNILTSFLSEENAISCAADILSKFTGFLEKEYNRCSISMGLSFGAPVTKGDNLFGDVIDMAKKLGFIAGENQIYISSILGKVYNKLKSNYDFSNAHIKVLSSRTEDFLIRLFKTIEIKWNEKEFNIDNLVSQFGISRAQLYRKVTDLTGYSPNNFIREIRLKNALKLIEAQKGNISEIAYEAGFNNPSYFSKCFFKKYGMLPSEYARNII